MSCVQCCFLNLLQLHERSSWSPAIELGGKYYTTRNNSSLVAFTVGLGYKSGNGIAMIAGHVDANTIKLKPVSKKPIKAGYVQLGVAPYSGGMNITWWDRDLSIGGKVLVKDQSGKTTARLVKLGWPSVWLPFPHLS
jgi:aminopeptidase I